MTVRIGRRARVTLFTFFMLLAGATRAAIAQSARIPMAEELRADAMGGRRTSVQGGVGVQIPAGPYVRVGVIAGLGAHTGSPHTGAGRLDVAARFLLDPYRQTRWGLSAGGGVSLRADAGEKIRPKLLVLADLEGPRSTHGFSPAVQLGLGGGVRVGVGLRTSGRTTR
ncbi:MAG: hypothetical protein JWL95_2666 [Gemmatimonadetes bacterium]|nr:hypothetical protein [Gemmatimonadota bacterium]